MVGATQAQGKRNPNARQAQPKRNPKLHLKVAKALSLEVLKFKSQDMVC
jgi:hypothetical protein